MNQQTSPHTGTPDQVTAKEKLTAQLVDQGFSKPDAIRAVNVRMDETEMTSHGLSYKTINGSLKSIRRSLTT